MKWRYSRHRQEDAPFLAPLSHQNNASERVRAFARNLPSAAAPIALTLAGGLALVVVIASFLGSENEAISTQINAAPVIAQESVSAEDAPAPSPVGSETGQSSEALAASPPEQPQIQDQQTEPALEFAMPVLDDSDPASTASILAAVPAESDLRPDVEVAETEDEIAELEAAQSVGAENDLAAEPVSETTASVNTSGPTMQPARTTGYVNMRAGADDSADVLTVVPAQAQIQAESDCNWCAVSYDGRTGYIYRTFLAYE